MSDKKTFQVRLLEDMKYVDIKSQDPDAATIIHKTTGIPIIKANHGAAVYRDDHLLHLNEGHWLWMGQRVEALFALLGEKLSLTDLSLGKKCIEILGKDAFTLLREGSSMDSRLERFQMDYFFSGPVGKIPTFITCWKDRYRVTIDASMEASFFRWIKEVE